MYWYFDESLIHIIIIIYFWYFEPSVENFHVDTYLEISSKYFNQSGTTDVCFRRITV